MMLLFRAIVAIGICAAASAQTQISAASARAAEGNPSAAGLGVFVVSGTPRTAAPLTFSANPNPLQLTPGSSTGKTTLSWNAPGHKGLIIRVGGKLMAASLPASGSVDTGTWVTDGMLFSLIDPLIAKTLATVTIQTGAQPPPGQVTFTANPNPITLSPGETVGQTTLSWNAPGYSQLVVRIGGKDMTGTVGPTGTAQTGKWVTDGMVFSLVDLATGKTLATATVQVISSGPQGPVTFTANPNPITLSPGETAGQTTLSWNAPGYSRLVVRIGGKDLTGTVGSSGTAQTGKWVTEGMVFSLVDLASGKTLSTVSVQVISPVIPVQFTITNWATAAALAKDSFGNDDFCATPVPKSIFSPSDPAVWIWLTVTGNPGDTFSVQWVHPSGRVDVYDPAILPVTSGCYAWAYGIAGGPAASELGNWAVRVVVNGHIQLTVPFTIAFTARPL